MHVDFVRYSHSGVTAFVDFGGGRKATLSVRVADRVVFV
jgi:hypothetical protein